MTSKRSRKKSGKRRRTSDGKGQDAHVRTCRAEQRRLKIRGCRDYKMYERKRKEEGKVKRIRIKRLRNLIRDTFHDANEHGVARIACLVDMTSHSHSYRVHVAYMNEHSGSVNMYGLKKVPSKSGLHGWARDLAGRIDAVIALLGAQSGDDAHGTLLGDSSGFSIIKYADWEDAKRGIISRREFDKLHVLMAPHGAIVTCMVTAGRTHDSPIFREMYGRVPRGDGHVILDAAYLARANCDMIARSGRTPVICPRKNSKTNGFHAMGMMLKWRRDDPEGFGKAYHRRSLVETAFSVIKERFGAVARAKTFAMRELQLVLRCICYNLVA